MSSITGRPPKSKYGSSGNYDSDSRAGELQIERQRLAALDRKIAALNAHGRDLAQWPLTGPPTFVRRELETLRTICLEKIKKYGGTP